MNNFSEQFYPDSGFQDDLKSALQLNPRLQNTYEMQEDGLYERLGATPLAGDYDSPLLSASPYSMDNSNSAADSLFDQGLDQYLSHEFDDIADLLTTGHDSAFTVAPDDFSHDIAIANTNYLDENDETFLEDNLFRGDSPMLSSNSSSLSPQGFGATAYSPEPALSTPTPSSLTASGQQRRKPRRKAAARAVQGFTQLEETLPTINSEPLYPDPTALGVPSPAPSTSSSCGYSDTYVEEAPQRVRQRRPRVSYQTLTEEEKYKRIRDLNNEASKNYRERQKSQLTKLEHQIPALEDRNKRLRAKEAGLVKLLSQMKLVQENIFSQQMNSNSNSGQQMNSNSGTLSFNQF